MLSLASAMDPQLRKEHVMQRWIKTAAIGVVVAALAGCESAVLVNNRPDRDSRDWNQPAANPDNAQNANAQIAPGDRNDAQPANATIAPYDDNDSEQPAEVQVAPGGNNHASPADQNVSTKNTRIESSSD
jgi:hypothetical protein